VPAILSCGSEEDCFYLETTSDGRRIGVAAASALEMLQLLLLLLLIMMHGSA